MIERGQCLNRVVFTTTRVIFKKIVKLPSNPITQVQPNNQPTITLLETGVQQFISYFVLCTSELVQPIFHQFHQQFHQLFFFSAVVRKLFEQRLRVYNSFKLQLVQTQCSNILTNTAKRITFTSSIKLHTRPFFISTTLLSFLVGHLVFWNKHIY